MGLADNDTNSQVQSTLPSLHHDFHDFINDHGLQQLVREPTREDNTLDLYLTNCPQLIPRTEVIPGLSDHNIPYCEFIINTTKKKQAQYEVPVNAKANWTSLKEVNLSSTMVESKDTATTEELWNIFKTTLQDAAKEHIPHKTTPKISQPWVTAEIRKLIHKRDQV